MAFNCELSDGENLPCTSQLLALLLTKALVCRVIGKVAHSARHVLRAMLRTKSGREILKISSLAGNFARGIPHPNCWPGSIARSEVMDARTLLL